jgi:Dicarboxylate transport
MKAKLRFVKPLLLSCLITTLLFLIFLPFLSDTYLLPRLKEQLPFSHKELSLSKITPWKIRGSLRLMQNGVLVTDIPKFEIQYSPASLINREIETILLDSPTLHLHYSDGALSLPGVTNKAIRAESPESPEKPTTPVSFTSPVSIKKIIIRNSRIALQKETKLYNLIVNSQIQLGFTSEKEKKYKLSTLEIDTATSGPLTLKSYIQGIFNTKGMLFNAEVNTSDITEINDLIPDNQNIKLTGALAASGQIALTPNMTISHYQLDTDIDSFKGSVNKFIFSQTSSHKPVHIYLEGDHQSLNFDISGFSTKAPEKTDITSTGKIDITNKSVAATATVHPPRLNSPFTVEMRGEIKSETTLATLKITGDGFAIDKDTSVGQTTVDANISYEDAIVTALVTGTISDITSLPHELFLENINWDIPLQFPLQNNNSEKKGKINIQALNYKNVETAGLSANLHQTSDGFNYTADLISQMDFSGKIHCSGSVFSNGNATSSCTLPKTTIDSSLLPSYIEIPEGNAFTGVVAANATFERTEAGQKGHLSLHLFDGTVTSGTTVIKEIVTTISFPNLPNLQSKPHQLATIGSIESGKIHLQNGKVFFRIENEVQLFLEKARLSWCGGKVEMGSLSLSSEMKDLEATLYCDRLGFAELLKQFGIEDTDGEGSLNGRLPVAINDKGIKFDDGFLFSTPGNSGIVRFNNTDQLRQGMPDIGQTATLDYSVKALENFAYNWTKLSFNTEGKDLLLTMQLDGKPADPLPFGYKNGQIVATEEGPGLQHPVRLDMNFRLPLQDLFQSGKSLQSFMEKM